jgi:prophage tail gpP-like protein
LIQICAPYGFSQFQVNSPYDKVIDKIVVEVGDSEWDCIFREAQKLGLWLWCTPDGTIITDILNYKEQPSYTFTNDLSYGKAIRIKRFRKKKRGADLKSEVWVRGHGQKAFTVKHKHDPLVKKGLNRRMIIEDGEAQNISNGERTAKRLIEERIRGSFEIELTINGKHHIEINKTAYVSDKRTKTEGVFFIVGVRHKKNDNVGNEKIIRLRPLWEGL